MASREKYVLLGGVLGVFLNIVILLTISAYIMPVYEPNTVLYKSIESLLQFVLVIGIVGQLAVTAIGIVHFIPKFPPHSRLWFFCYGLIIGWSQFLLGIYVLGKGIPSISPRKIIGVIVNVSKNVARYFTEGV